MKQGQESRLSSVEISGMGEGTMHGKRESPAGREGGVCTQFGHARCYPIIAGQAITWKCVGAGEYPPEARDDR